MRALEEGIRREKRDSASSGEVSEIIRKSGAGKLLNGLSVKPLNVNKFSTKLLRAKKWLDDR